SGNFYRPAYDFNNIPGWFVDQGYQVLVTDDAVLSLTGMTVFADAPIGLEDGWQIVSYYPRQPVEATIALSGIVDHLEIAKDGRGNFYVPAWDFSNMGEMVEGQGYYLKIDTDDVIELVYRTGEEEAASAGHRSVYDEPGRLPVHAVTGGNMSLLVTTESPLQEGVEVGVYVGGELVGSGVLRDDVCGISVWGDDPFTDVVDGALSGQRLEVMIFDDSGLHAVDYNVVLGGLTYETDGFSVISLVDSAVQPFEFGIVSLYPNPFNGILRIGFHLDGSCEALLKVYDLQGREAAELFRGGLKAGLHEALWDAADFPAGVYILRLTAANRTQIRKVLLVK
ncbi:MAG TPA: T9SS type A sorting domain-containing protein, partial [Bacteroidetes bacterium]|nr:T9SS type A sorting domain-containing protein [Bacteroidota bacterium]